MDPVNGWFAIGGAAAAGVPTLISALVQAGSARGQRKHEERQAEAARVAAAAEAEAQRIAQAAEAEAQRKAQAAEAEANRRAQQRADNNRQIEEWREGLAEASKLDAEWHLVNGPRPSRMAGDPPNIVPNKWFQSLRPHIVRKSDNSNAYLLDHDNIDCDGAVADLIGREINRIAESWVQAEEGRDGDGR